MKNILIITMLMLLCAASCKKDNKNEDQLPPATQTGANTFGCLVNGKVFVPKGYGSTGRPNPHVQYDYDLNGQPYVSISAIQFLENSTQNYCDIVFRNLTTTGNYSFPTGFENFVAWQSLLGNCYTPAYDTTVRKWGGDNYKT